MTDVGDRKPAFYVNGERFAGATGSRMTGAEILAFAGLDPADYALVAEGHAGRRIEPEQPVPVQEGSRFLAVPRE